jgi:hypothetical protein
MTPEKFHVGGGVPAYDRPVTEPETVDPALSIRRIALAALLAVALAAATALVLSLDHGDDGGRAPVARSSLFTAAFTEPGFLDGNARLVSAWDRPPSVRRLSVSVRLPAGTTAYVVARCDTGSLEVAAGAAGSSTDCKGASRGVVALQAPRLPLHLVVTVAAPQRGRWGVAVYRSS